MKGKFDPPQNWDYKFGVNLKITSWKPHLMPDDLAAKCRSLTLRGEGEMSEHFSHARLHREGTAWVCTENDLVLGWALMTPDEDEDGDGAKFYVRKNYRRKGIGTKLVEEVTKYNPDTIVYAHDTVSTEFFEALKDDHTYYINTDRI